MDEKDDGLNIVPYNVQKHGEQVQDLMNKYLIPTYLKRMGLRVGEVTDKYYLAEDVLHPQAAMNTKFEEGFSFVAVDKSYRVLGCHLCYHVTKKQFKSDFVDSNYEIMNDDSYKESVRKYCQHRYAVCRDWPDLYDTYGMEKILYMESVILHPDIRGGHTHHKLELSSVVACDERHGILVEGMWPVKKFLEVHPESSVGQVLGDVEEHTGFVLIERNLSYDGYVTPVYFRPPKNCA